jgi:hypothetical protein
LFREALEGTHNAGPVALQKVRDAAIRSYTMSESETRYLFRDLNARLRKVTEYSTLSVKAIRQAAELVLGDLMPYADLLGDALKKLDATSADAVPLYRGQLLSAAALQHLRQHEGAVMAFTSFTSFSDDKSAAIDYLAKAGGHQSMRKCFGNWPPAGG